MRRPLVPGKGRSLRLLAAGVLAVGALGVASTGATMSAQAGSPGNVFATTALYAPGGLTASPVGHDVEVAWSAGQNGDGYAVLGVSNGSSTDCSAASFSSLVSTSGLTYTDTGRSTPQGTWFCYQVKMTYASWTSVSGNPSAAAQVGFVVTSVTPSNGGTSGKLDAGDRIVVTVNQAVSPASGPGGTDTVCAINGGTILIGSATSSGACGTGESLALGKLTGGSSNKNARYNATWVWSNGNKTLTVTIGTRTSGPQDPTISGTWTFTPTTNTAKVLSASGAFHVCDTNTGGGACLPTVGSTF